MFPLVNTFFNLNDKYFLHLSRLSNACKRLTVTKWFLLAFQASLPESGFIFDSATLWHSLLQLRSSTVTLGSLLAVSLSLFLFLNSAVSVSYLRISCLDSFTGLKTLKGQVLYEWVYQQLFLQTISKKLTLPFQWSSFSLSLVVANGIPCK